VSSPSVAAPPYFKIEYRFDIGDVDEARKAAYGIWRRKRRMQVVVISAILFASTAFLTYLNPLVNWIWLLVAVGISVALPFTGRRVYKKAYDALWKSYKPLRLLHSAEIDGKGISYNAVIVSAHWDWEALSGWLETPGLFMISVSAGSYIWIPKRAFTGEQEVQRMRDLLQIKLLRKD
jgi:hypothetical protein